MRTRNAITRLVLMCGLLAVLGVVAMAVDGPLTPIMNLRVRTDANGYLLSAGGAYTAPDGPLTAMANLRGRTDANGYLLTASSPTAGGGTISAGVGVICATPSYTFAGHPADGFTWASTGHTVYCGNGSSSVDFGTGLTVGSGGTIGFSSTASPGTSGDTVFTRVAAGEWGWTAVAFASLGTPANGSFAYCNDCTLANPCAGAGTGALAKRLNGVWVCN